jgi:hypothetical protein
MKLYVTILSIIFVFSLPIIMRSFIPIPVSNEAFLFYYYPAFILSTFIFFMSASICFFMSFILKNKKTLLKKISIASLAATFILISNLTFGIIVRKIILNDLPYGSNYMKFNADLWKESGDSTVEIRQKMLKDLLKNILPGKSIFEIKTLLGKPDRIDENVISYVTGMSRISVFSVDMEVLMIFFDENQIFKNYKIAEG